MRDRRNKNQGKPGLLNMRPPKSTAHGKKRYARTESDQENTPLTSPTPVFPYIAAHGFHHKEYPKKEHHIQHNQKGYRQKHEPKKKTGRCESSRTAPVPPMPRQKCRQPRSSSAHPATRLIKEERWSNKEDKRTAPNKPDEGELPEFRVWRGLVFISPESHDKEEALYRVAIK